METTSKKITRATFKSFIKKNIDSLYVKVNSSFDGMVDCVMPVDGGFKKAEKSDRNPEYTLGIEGVWLVGHSDDHFTEYSDGVFTGIKFYNCCGSGVIATK